MTTTPAPRPLWQDVGSLVAAVLAVIVTCVTAWAVFEGALRPWLPHLFWPGFVASVVALVLGFWAFQRRCGVYKWATMGLPGSQIHWIPQARWPYRVGGWVGFGCVTLLSLVLPQYLFMTDRAYSMATGGSLHQIGLAFENFSDTHGGLLPSAIVNERGERLLSWRVTLLPYLEQEALFKKFRLDEPWDSPHNLALLPKMPAVYASPRLFPTPPHHTRFQVITGPGTAFDGQVILRWPFDFPDGPSNTILVAEAEEAVPWTKPDDLRYDPNGPLPSFRKVGDGWTGPTSLSVLFADASTRSYSLRDVPEDMLRGLITRNGGEDVSADSPYDPKGKVSRPTRESEP